MIAGTGELRFFRASDPFTVAIDVSERRPACRTPCHAVARAASSQVVARRRFFATDANNGVLLQRLEHFLFVTRLGDLCQLELYAVAAIEPSEWLESLESLESLETLKH